jgi:hypothetical protein
MEARFHDAYVGAGDSGNLLQLEAFVFEQDQSFALEAGQLADHLRHQHGKFLIHPLVHNGDSFVLGGLHFRVIVAEAFEGEVAGYRK